MSQLDFGPEVYEHCGGRGGLIETLRPYRFDRGVEVTADGNIVRVTFPDVSRLQASIEAAVNRAVACGAPPGWDDHPDARMMPRRGLQCMKKNGDFDDSFPGERELDVARELASGDEPALEGESFPQAVY